MKHPLFSKIATQRGTTLIEVLVAVLILSVGLLGVAALQAVSLTNNNNSYLRAQATGYTYEYLDRIRASRLLMLATGMPANLLQQWNTEIADRLPGGTVTVTNNGDAFTVEVSWIDDLSVDAGADPDDDQRKISFAATSLI